MLQQNKKSTSSFDKVLAQAFGKWIPCAPPWFPMFRQLHTAVSLAPIIWNILNIVNL